MNNYLINTLSISVPTPFDKLYTTKKNYMAFASGRSAGKTFNLIEYALIELITKPNRDIVITRANYNSLRTSLFTEFKVIASMLGLTHLLDFKVSPLSITNLSGKNKVYFFGIGGVDMSRVRGAIPENPLSVFIVDEMQQLPTMGNFLHAVSSFNRFMDDDSKILAAFNYERGHWTNAWIKAKRIDPNYDVIESTYMDVLTHLPDIQLKDILSMKILNNKHYQYMYLGDVTAAFGAVYSAYTEEHYVPFDKIQKLFQKDRLRIETIIFGGDYAVRRDAVTFVAIAIMNNGRAVALDRFYHDPKEYGILSNNELIPLIETYVIDVYKKYGIMDSYGQLSEDINTYVAMDCASGDLIPTMEINIGYLFDDIIAITQKGHIETSDIVQNAFSRNALIVADFGGYRVPTTGEWIEDEHILNDELIQLIWADNGKEFNKTVKNDLSDALRYGASFYFRNPYNLWTIKDYYGRGDE